MFALGPAYAAVSDAVFVVWPMESLGQHGVDPYGKAQRLITVITHRERLETIRRRACKAVPRDTPNDARGHSDIAPSLMVSDSYRSSISVPARRFWM